MQTDPGFAISDHISADILQDSHWRWTGLIQMHEGRRAKVSLRLTPGSYVANEGGGGGVVVF